MFILWYRSLFKGGFSYYCFPLSIVSILYFETSGFFHARTIKCISYTEFVNRLEILLTIMKNWLISLNFYPGELKDKLLTDIMYKPYSFIINN